MGSKVAMKMLQYKVADSLDKVRLPNNPRALITKENSAGQFPKRSFCCFSVNRYFQSV